MFNKNNFFQIMNTTNLSAISTTSSTTQPNKWVPTPHMWDLAPRQIPVTSWTPKDLAKFMNKSSLPKETKIAVTQAMTVDKVQTTMKEQTCTMALIKQMDQIPKSHHPNLPKIVMQPSYTNPAKWRITTGPSKDNNAPLLKIKEGDHSAAVTVANGRIIMLQTKAAPNTYVTSSTSNPESLTAITRPNIKMPSMRLNTTLPRTPRVSQLTTVDLGQILVPHVSTWPPPPRTEDEPALSATNAVDSLRLTDSSPNDTTLPRSEQ